MTEREDILAFLRERKQVLFTDYQLVKLGLFGSFARNEATEISDIDLIIEFRPNTKEIFEKKINIKHLIQTKFDRKVDLCREKYIKPYFKSQILESVIYV